MKKLKKIEIIEQVAERTGLSKTNVNNAVSVLLDVITESLKKDNCASFPGFGGFHLKLRAARKGRNPKNGDIIQIKEQMVVTFKSGSLLKKNVSMIKVVES